MTLKSPWRSIQARRKRYEDAHGLLQPKFDFDPALVTFTPSMAKRAGKKVFDAAPIVQGKWDQSSGSDELSITRGTQFGNPTGRAYANFDPYQGTISLWFTPEHSSADLTSGRSQIFNFYTSGGYVRYDYAVNAFQFRLSDAATYQQVACALTAGTTYFLCFSWDTKNSIDGTNYQRTSINDVHTYGITTANAIDTPSASLGVGHSFGNNPVNAIVEGLRVDRRVWYDGTYGTPLYFNASGPIDEIAAAYAAGAGADPALVIGSWDGVFCLPTNSAVGALATGTGEAWSHPHNSNLPETWGLWDGYYGGYQWALEYNGSSTYVNCGSGAGLDDLGSGKQFTIDCWFRQDANSTERILVAKGTWGSAGWGLELQLDRIYARVDLAGTDAVAHSGVSSAPEDGKWHLATMHYDDATKTLRVAVDGRWGTPSVGAGAWQSDAARDLIIGRGSDGSFFFMQGAIGWIEISDNNRHTAGTNFKPPRSPYDDGNTVESWHANDGTGATLAATITSPGNDGTITAGTWQQQWLAVGTPVVPTSLEFDGSATVVDCGSGATLDNVPSGGTITWDGWVRNAATVANTWTIVEKGDAGANRGWVLYVTSGNVLTMLVQLGTTDATATIAMPRDNKWHHVAAYYDDTSKRCRVALDGIWGTLGAAGVGAYQADAADNLNLGRSTTGAVYWNGAYSWQRYSDNDRHGAASVAAFVPPDRVNPPAVDGNTVEQWNLDEGAGTTATAQVTSPANDGTITMGSGRWWNTPDMPSDSPGSRVYQWGYAIGSDGANDGVHQHKASVAAGSNHVVRVPVGYEADKRARPYILAYDETNGAAISTFRGPFLTGTHDGGNNQAALSDSTAPYWPYSLVGSTVYNITDVSSATITACGTSIAGGLAGGTDNDWDNGDVYFIVPKAGWRWCEPFTYELPTIARNGAAADCTEVSWHLLNSAGAGVVYWNEIQVLTNLIDNPSLETGAGAPWIPDGWANDGLGVGDSQASTTGGNQIHSGSDCMQWNAGAVSGERITQTLGGVTSGKYYMRGGWFYTTASIGLGIRPAQQAVLQYDSALDYVASPVATFWLESVRMYRATGATPIIRIIAISGAVGSRYSDDHYVVLCDDVTLTCTPANQANSTETTGLRIDGRDACTQPIPAGVLKASKGWIRWRVTPRHGAGHFLDWLEVTNVYLGYWFADGNNYILLRQPGADRIDLIYNAGGAGAQTGSLIGTGLVVGTTYLFEIRYTGSRMRLFIDGVAQITINAAVAFSVIPATAYWANTIVSDRQGDMTMAAP